MEHLCQYLPLTLQQKTAPMRCINIKLAQTGQIHKLSLDYLNSNPATRELYDFTPDLAGIASAIEARKSFPVKRKALVDALSRQYASIPGKSLVLDNIKSLGSDNTFTVTTGHQLNIFTGPLYYIYKLVSVIKYAEILKNQFPNYHFVPVYWMASEDHDLEEINHFHIWGKTLRWDEKAGEAVGRLNPHSLSPLIDEISGLTANSPGSAALTDLLKKAYLEHNTLADAVRYLVNELFGDSGLVVMDADDAELKKALIPVLEKDIFENSFYADVNKTIEKIQNDYKIPLSPREINVFYLGENSRHRIVFEDDKYKVFGSEKIWSGAELKTELHEHPEHFSPNVVLRPVYQELILPNLAYIGGNHEIAYWLELKAAFKNAGVFYPQVLVRDSALIIGKKAAEYLAILKLQPEDMFLSPKEIKAKYYEVNELEHNSEKEIALILEQYEKLRNDLQGLPSDLAANIVKQMNIQVKEVRKWKNDIHQKQLELQEKYVAKLDKIYATFYPEGEFQERYDNFIPYYLQYGREWFNMLKESFNVLDADCHIFIEE